MIAFLPRRDFQLFQGSLVQVEVKMLASNMQQFNIIQLQVKYIAIELWPKPEFYSFILTIHLPRTLPRCFRGHSFHFRGRSRATIHFRSASANISIVEVRNVARNAFRVLRRLHETWFSDPFRESLRGASALRVFTSARSSYFKPKIKRIHGGFGRCSIQLAS